ncbi:hypothetical protein C1H46_019771 [Malus baccata]|uniref:Uncharacterized protein n=1 Tax=Malus baccata TaxID=106549 RepID=A0A540M740_MALBA|nr:hypothetical protein C1H46_019771 [Malus baccata]
MKGYSRSEVTVIDTSCGVWKTDKLVFRRKNVWKVREKKVKGRSSGRHKRKVVDEEHVGDDIDKKKAKVSVSALDVEAGGDACIALNSIHEGQRLQNDTLDNLKDGGEEFGKFLPDNKTKDIRKGQVRLKLQSDLTILCCCLGLSLSAKIQLNYERVEEVRSRAGVRDGCAGDHAYGAQKPQPTVNKSSIHLNAEKKPFFIRKMAALFAHPFPASSSSSSDSLFSFSLAPPPPATAHFSPLSLPTFRAHQCCRRSR